MKGGSAGGEAFGGRYIVRTGWRIAHSRFAYSLMDTMDLSIAVSTEENLRHHDVTNDLNYPEVG